MTFIAIGPTEIIRDALCGPQQHDEHVKHWRWNDYLSQTQAGTQAFLAEFHRQQAEARAAREAKSSQPVYIPTKVSARHMQVGDVVGSGETVIGISAGVRTPRGKIEVTLEKNGYRRLAVWGAYTLINVRRVA